MPPSPLGEVSKKRIITEESGGSKNKHTRAMLSFLLSNLPLLFLYAGVQFEITKKLNYDQNTLKKTTKMSKRFRYIPNSNNMKVLHKPINVFVAFFSLNAQFIMFFSEMSSRMIWNGKQQTVSNITWLTFIWANRITFQTKLKWCDYKLNADILFC